MKFIISIILSILTFKRSLLLMVISSVFISLIFNRKIKFRYKAFTIVFLSSLLLIILNSETLMTMLRLHYIFGSMDTLVILDKITSGRVTEVMQILTYYNGASDYILGKGIGFQFMFNGKEQHFSHFLLLSYGNMLGWIFASLLFLKMLFSIFKPVKYIDKPILFYKSILFGFLIGSLTSSYILYYPFYWVILGLLVTKQKKMRKHIYKGKLKNIAIQKSN